MQLWRILFAERAASALDPVGNPEGRFHHDGQKALYAALTPEGAGASLTRYLGEDDPPRVIVGLELSGGRLLDLDDDTLGFPPTVPSHRWDLDRKDGRRPPTWDLADAVRASGHDGFLYRSRLRPDLKNLALFRWNSPAAPTLAVNTPTRPWP